MLAINIKSTKEHFPRKRQSNVGLTEVNQPRKDMRYKCEISIDYGIEAKTSQPIQ
jgi:transposase-like protein